MINIDQQMAYIRKAIEKGASVNISFHNINDETEALQTAYTFSQMVKGSFEEVSGGAFNWFKVNGPIQTTVFFNKQYMEEDVKLDGMPEESSDRIA